MSAPPGVDPLNYEVNLECANCGHAQFMHCDHPMDPCGCVSLRHRATATTGSVACTCERFVRPDSSGSPRDDVWWDHAHSGSV